MHEVNSLIIEKSYQLRAVEGVACLFMSHCFGVLFSNSTMVHKIPSMEAFVVNLVSTVYILYGDL